MSVCINLLDQKLLKPPMDLEEHALAVVASHTLWSAVQYNPVAVCWLLGRGNDRARSLQCSAAQSPSGVLSAALMFNCLPMLGLQDTCIAVVWCNSLFGTSLPSNLTCSQGSCDAVIFVRKLYIKYINYI